MSMLITASACGYVDIPVRISHILNTGFPRFLGVSHAIHRVIHTCPVMGPRTLGALRATVNAEGHPRGNGDGPLTRSTRLNRERG